MGDFKIIKDKDGNFTFHLLADSGQVIAYGSIYYTKTALNNGIDSVRKNAVIAGIIDTTKIE